MKSIKLFLILLMLVFVGFGIQAEEGMWMPHQMKDLDLKALGLQMDPAKLYSQDGTGLMSAIVHLGGGTAEFVSQKGLAADKPSRRFWRTSTGLYPGKRLYPTRISGADTG